MDICFLFNEGETVGVVRSGAQISAYGVKKLSLRFSNRTGCRSAESGLLCVWGILEMLILRLSLNQVQCMSSLASVLSG